ncbi:MAG: DUF1569 domain-containing protein [Alphaproteobacteria bacterium]|nr:DUF1569 domain-containing protein [Alphaproteobacteria bacterium]
MKYPLIYEKSTTSELLNRLNNLTPQHQRLWGKMSVSQMLAHLNVPYLIIKGDIQPKIPFLVKLLFSKSIKKKVVEEKDYEHNLRTGPDFIIKDDKNFELEKKKLEDLIKEVHLYPSDYFEGKVHPLFGKMTANEWSVMFYKHLDHHFRQFGV